MALEIFTRLGRLVKVKNTKTKAFSHESETYQALLIKTPGGAVKCLLFTEAEISKAEARADKNIEDQPKQSWISVLLD